MTSQNGQIGLKLKFSDTDTSLRLQRLQKSEEIQQFLKSESVGFKFQVYFKNEDNDEKDSQLTIQNGLCLIDTFKRLVDFHTNGKKSESTEVEELYSGLIIFLENIIATDTSSNNDKSEIEILEKMLEFAQSAADTKEYGQMFTPFPNDDLIRMLLPDIPRILLQEPTGLTNTAKFDQLISISSVSATGSFPYDRVNSLLETLLQTKKPLVFKLGKLHFWPSLDEKEWEKRPQDDFSETIQLLSQELEAINQECDKTTNIKLSDAIDKKTILLTAVGESQYMIRKLLVPQPFQGWNRVDSIGKKLSKDDVDEYLCGEDTALELVAVEYNKEQGSKKYLKFELFGALQDEVRQCVEKAFEVLTDMIDNKLSVENLEKRLNGEFLIIEDYNVKDYDADYEDDGEDDEDDDEDDDDYDDNETDDDNNDADDSDHDDNASDEADEVVIGRKRAKMAQYLYAYFCSDNTVKVFCMVYGTNICVTQL